MKYSNDFSVIPQLAENRGWVFNYDDATDSALENAGVTPQDIQNAANSLGGLIGGDAGNAISMVGSDISSGNWVKAISDTVTGIVKIIKGRTYTKGKYTLGEKYMQHILNSSINSETKVPDAAVPAAIDFFTKGFGIPITTIEDLDVLDSNLHPNGDNVNLYKTTRDPLYAQIPDANVALAVRIKKFLPYNPPMNDWQPQHWDFPTAYRQAGIVVTPPNAQGQGGGLSLGSASSGHTIVWVLIALVVIAFAIFLIAKAVK